MLQNNYVKNKYII